MTRSFYRHTFVISYLLATAYKDKGEFPVPLINPLGTACIHPSRQAAGDSAKVSLNALELPGVTFREAWFTPTFSKYKGKLCGGCQVHVINKSIFRPFSATLFIIQTIRELYPEQLIFHEKYFDRIMGTSSVREALEAEKSVTEIISDYSGDLINFRELRKPYLLYD